jgi:hypothetical protein
MAEVACVTERFLYYENPRIPIMSWLFRLIQPDATHMKSCFKGVVLGHFAKALVFQEYEINFLLSLRKECEA